MKTMKKLITQQMLAEVALGILYIALVIVFFL